MSIISFFPGGGKPYGIEYLPILVSNNAASVTGSYLSVVGMGNTTGNYYWGNDGSPGTMISDRRSSEYFSSSIEYKILQECTLYLRTYYVMYRDSYYGSTYAYYSNGFVHYSSVLQPGDIASIFMCSPYSLTSMRTYSSTAFNNYACVLPKLYINGNEVYNYNNLLGYIFNYASSYTSAQALNGELPERNYPFGIRMTTLSSTWAGIRNSLTASAYLTNR